MAFFAIRFALLTVEVVGDLVPELELAAMLWAVELRRVELEVFVVVEPRVFVFLGATRLKLLETQILRCSAHEVFIEAVLRG